MLYFALMPCNVTIINACHSLDSHDLFSQNNLKLLNVQITHHTEWAIIMHTVRVAFLQQEDNKITYKNIWVRVEVKNLAITNNGQKLHKITS